MRSLFLLVCLPVALALGGCGTPPERRLSPVELRVSALKATGSDSYALTVRFLNPNTTPTAIVNATHVVKLGDTRVGTVNDREAVGVAPLSSTEHVVKVKPSIGKEITAYIAAHPGEIRVTLDSDLELAISGDDTMKMKSGGSGTVTP